MFSLHVKPIDWNVMKKVFLLLVALLLLSSCQFGKKKEREERKVTDILDVTGSLLQSSFEAQSAILSNDIGGFTKAYINMAGGMLDMVELYGEALVEAGAITETLRYEEKPQQPMTKEDWDALKEVYGALYKCTMTCIDVAARQQERERMTEEAEFKHKGLRSR